MIDNEKIPESSCKELIDLLGYEKAEKFLNEVKYNFRAVEVKIFSERMKKNYGENFWLYFWIIIVVISVVVYISITN